MHHLVRLIVASLIVGGCSLDSVGIVGDPDGVADVQPTDAADAVDGLDDPGLDPPPDSDALDTAPVDVPADVPWDTAPTDAPDATDAADLPDLPDALDDPDAVDVPAEVPCPSDCSGHGTCSAGVCTCFTGFAPPACDHCLPGYVGYPACTPCGALGLPCCDSAPCDPSLVCEGGFCVDPCPADMVRIGAMDVCIDRWEASRSSSTAVSAPAASPWTSIGKATASSACTNAGKRLCTSAEWRAACEGPSGWAYPYGTSFVAHACNDTNAGPCPKNGTGVLPTGSLSTCEGGFAGIFDMSGNVWEWVSDTSSGRCGLMGGSVDSCADAATLACANLAWQDCGLTWPALGVRCCVGF